MGKVATAEELLEFILTFDRLQKSAAMLYEATGLCFCGKVVHPVFQMQPERASVRT